MFDYPRIRILQAIDRADIATVRRLVESGGIPDIEEDVSVLTAACKAGDIEIVRYLLEVGNYRGRYSAYIPEVFAAMKYEPLEVFRLLCEYGFDPNAQELSKHGESITDLAIRERRVEFLRLLLPKEPWIYVEYEDDETTEEEFESRNSPSTLELAARAGDVEMARLLVEAGFPLREKSPEYYLNKADQNALKYQQRLKKQAEIERKIQEQGKHDWENAHRTEISDFWVYLVLILFGIALCWVFWRLFLWLGWLGVLGGVVALVFVLYLLVRNADG